MKTENFCFWLQGYFELANPSIIDAKGVELIKKHLAMVFIHDIDPSEGNKVMQDVLNEIHSKPEETNGNAKPDNKKLPGGNYRC